MSSKPLEEFVREVNEKGGTYHQLHVGDGLTITGDYDMTKYVDYYCLPTDLKGRTVLDIGTSSGYFALESAGRGAKVTAIDIWEWTPLINLAELLNLDIRYVTKSIYDLDAGFGRFDVVICGSLLLHLPDPVVAIQRIHEVCKHQAIIATASPFDRENDPRPICEFIGKKAYDSDYWTYWTINQEALRRMLLAAGFSRIGEAQHFTLITEPGRTLHETRNVVLTAFVG